MNAADGLPYDPVAAFSPVARITISPTVLLISKDLPVQSFKEFVAYARRNPGKLAYASYGVGSSSHLTGELMNSLTSINMLHVPYKGSGPALTDLLGGQVQAMFSDPLSAKPPVDAGKVKAIAISGYERWNAYPDTPTYRELALEQMTSPGWWGLLTSSKTPREVAEKMADAVKGVLASASVKAKIRELGAEVSPLGPTEFAEFVKADTNRWASVVRLGNIDLDSGAR